MKIEIIKKNIPFLFLITLVGLLSTTPAVLTDLVIWDDVAIYAARQQMDYSNLWESMCAIGKPLYYLILSPSFCFENSILVLKILNSATIIMSSFIIFLFCSYFIRCRKEISLVVSLIFITFPAMQMNCFGIEYVYIFLYFAFLLGCFLFVSSSVCHSSLSRLLSIVAAIFFWFISFSMSSIIFIYYVFWVCMGIYYFYYYKQYKKFFCYRYFFYAIFFLNLPVFNYVAEKICFPLHDYFAGGYNIPSFNILFIIRNIKIAFLNSILTPFKDIFFITKTLSAVLFLLFFIFTFVILIWFWKKKFSQFIDDNHWKINIFLIKASLILLIVGLLPYAMVGKIPGISGVSTRHAILVSLPVGLFFAGFFGLFFSSNSRLLKALGIFAFSFIIIAFIIRNWQTYIDWQICSIKDKAIVKALKDIHPIPDGDFFLIQGKELEGIYDRRWYDWGYLFSRAWGGYSRIGKEEIRFKPESYPKGVHPIIPIQRHRVAAIMQFMYFGKDQDEYLTKRLIFKSSKIDISSCDSFRLILDYYSRKFRLCKETLEDWLGLFFKAEVDHDFSKVLSCN